MTEVQRAPTLLEEAKSLLGRGDIAAAIPKLAMCLNDDFFNDEILFLLGGCFIGQGMNGLGAVVTSAAIDARAGRNHPFPEALRNLGTAYKAEHNNEVAEKVWRAGLKHETIPSERAKTLANMSGLFVNEGQPLRAIELCDEALMEDPNNAVAQTHRGMACLELGRWREGFTGWLSTYRTGDRNKRTYRDIPEWDGSPGKRLIVWGDQGVGDELFYGTCLRDLARISKHITFDCHPRLDRLFQRSFPEFTVHGTRKDLTDLPWLSGCDAEAAVALADLPCFLRLDGEWDNRPYLKTQGYDDPLLKKSSRRPRIGLSWTGGSKKTRQHLRSLSIQALEPIVKARPDAQFFSLQYTPDAAREVCELEEKTGIRIAHYPSWVECRDYDRTASFVVSLDLVITVCTTVHHLGGALGVPTWTLVPSRPSWRYQVESTTLPWYSSVKLYRQQSDGDWSAPVQRVAADLERLQ
jgi:tetratricopeptide (TPR) repeat protein